MTTSTLTFIQYDIPPLKSGQYTISATQSVKIANLAIEQNTFTANKTFAVPGNRFQLNGDDIVSLFPAPLSNGEYAGVLPLAVLRRDTLPWQRTSVSSEESAPWLAILLFDESDAPTLTPAVAADLFPAGTKITVSGSSVTGTGTMPEGIASYPDFNPLDYGQTPSDACSVIDVPIELFSKLCPSAEDLPLLAHIRKTDTYDATDSDTIEQDYAIVLGNRWPTPGSNVTAYLISLENFGDLLPSDDGTPSAEWPVGATTVRLICFQTWSFFANDLDERFASLCENLNRDAEGTLGLTTLRLPATTPDQAAMTDALANQATGTLTEANADALAGNALSMGYTALDHDLREAGHTVSWYRGPLVPYPLQTWNYTIASCPDALLRYDPQTGMFDVTYAQAWQLGQLLALQNKSFSVALYSWKQRLQKTAAAQAEMALINEKLGGTALPSFFAQRTVKTSMTPTVPADIASWIGRLQLLKAVPFAALVPDEAMLPVESLRFFYVDQDWIAAIVDGAFSVGRNGTTGAAKDGAALTRAMKASSLSARQQRKNHRPALAAQQEAAGDTSFATVTGVLLRSQIISGWPGLNVNGYADLGGTGELPKLRMERLSNDVLICLFEGVVQMLTIGEPPEQLHCGAEGSPETGWTTTLREITGNTPGAEYTDADGEPVSVAVAVREDRQTINAAATAKTIQTALNADYDQNLTTFTSAEFALEMVKGVVSVEYRLS